MFDNTTVNFAGDENFENHYQKNTCRKKFCRYEKVGRRVFGDES